MYDKAKILIDRREMLRVKLKSLAAEAKLIRREEARTFGTLLNELRAHRTGVVRSEARHTVIAYGLIKGRPYEKIEPSCKKPPDWEKVKRMCERYGPKGFKVPQVLFLALGIS